jgi:hypothetical protein
MLTTEWRQSVVNLAKQGKLVLTALNTTQNQRSKFPLLLREIKNFLHRHKDLERMT